MWMASYPAIVRRAAWSARGIEGPIEVTPTALEPNIGLIDTPRFVRRLEMAAQSLFQCVIVTLYPTPNSRAIHLQPALGEQLFDIAERARVAKIPAHMHKESAPARSAAT